MNRPQQPHSRRMAAKTVRATHDGLATLKELMASMDAPQADSNLIGDRGSPRFDATVASNKQQWHRTGGGASGRKFALRDQPPRIHGMKLADLHSRIQPTPRPSSSSRAGHLKPPSTAAAALAHAAAEAGVSPAFASAPASFGSTGLVFQSNAVRFSVTLAEHLERTEQANQASPSAEGCYTCLEVLSEMLPLLGPLAPVIRNVHDALELCLLSEHHYSDDGLAAAALTTPSPRSARRNAGTSAHQATGHRRVPYFILVRKLEEAAAALRLERDTALEQVGRNVADLTNLDEQLIAAKAQLQVKARAHTLHVATSCASCHRRVCVLCVCVPQVKTATIDKLVREHAGLQLSSSPPPPWLILCWRVSRRAHRCGSMQGSRASCARRGSSRARRSTSTRCSSPSARRSRVSSSPIRCASRRTSSCSAGRHAAVMTIRDVITDPGSDLSSSNRFPHATIFRVCVRPAARSRSPV